MTYEDYLGIYTGIEEIPRGEFDFYAEKAAALLSSFTGGRSNDADDDEVLYAAVEIAQFLFEGRGRHGVVGESNDGLSVDYSADSDEKEAYKIARAWLGDSGLMYCGIGGRRCGGY